MRLHRFYLPEPIGKDQTIHVGNRDLLHQWTHVFRMRIGDRVILFSGDGKEYEGVIELVSKKEAIVHTIDASRAVPAPRVALSLFPAIIKKDHVELVVEKCTEIGAAAFYPVIAERSEKKDVNVERLRKIAIEAAEQSGKARVPAIAEPGKLEAAIKKFSGKMFALDFGAENVAKAFEKFSAPVPVGILVGPEGGWTDEERNLFKKYRIQSVSLGSQILRAETAAIAACTLVLLP